MKYLVNVLTPIMLGLAASAQVAAENGASNENTTTNEPSFQALPFNLQAVKDRIVPIDLNADGLIDLLTAADKQLSVYLQKNTAAPFNFDKADISLELPGQATGWDLDWDTQQENNSNVSNIRIVALVDGKKVLTWPINNSRLGEEQVLIENASGNLPLGAYPLDFVRDINNDQLNDYVIPGSDHHTLYLQDADGNFKGDIQIKSNLWIQSRLSPDNQLSEKVGQHIRIPNIRIRDMNGDKVKDLISRSNNLLEVFLAKPDGSYAHQPSYSYDFSEIEERLGDIGFDDIDFSNLSAMTRYSYNFTLDDIDGDKVEDLMIQEGGKVHWFRGTKSGMELDKPHQVLRSGGNVFAALLLDEDEDDLKDLWLMRIEDISAGQVFVWLALSGSINIEAYIYRNEGERFARRPHRKKTVSIAFPSGLSLLGTVGDIREKSDSKDITRTLAAKLGGEEATNDLLILDQQSIRVHLNVLEDQLSEEDLFLGLIDDIREKDEFEINIKEILSNISLQGQKHLSIVQDHPEDFLLALGSASEDLEPGSDIQVMDLNGDQVDDILLLTQRKDDSIKGVLYISQ